METENTEKQRHSLFFPLLLIAIGAVFFLNTMGILKESPWELFLRMWPLLFIAGGLDSLYKREGFVGPVFFIGLGLLFLLGNLGMLQVSPWNMLIRLWPVFLIVWGLDLLIGKNSVASAVIGVFIGLALLAGIVWLAVASPLQSHVMIDRTVSYELGTTQQLEASVQAISGEMQIGKETDSTRLIGGQLQLGQNEELVDILTEEEGKSVLTLESTGSKVYPVMPFGPTDTMLWHVTFNPQVLLDLDSQLIVGKQQVDLRDMMLSGLDVETVVGKAEVVLPANGNFEGELSVVIGELVIIVPRGTALEIETDTAITAITKPDAFTKTDDLIRSPEAEGATELIRLVVNQPIGSLVIRYAGE